MTPTAFATHGNATPLRSSRLAEDLRPKVGLDGRKTLSVAQELYDGDGKKLITYPRAEARYLTENQISDVPAIVAALTRLRGFAQLEIAPPVIRRGKSGHFCDKALEGISHHAVVPNISQGSTGLHGNARAPERIATRTRLL
jgi:DNA topoisomerase IA